MNFILILLLFYATLSLLWAPDFKHNFFQLALLSSNMAIFAIAFNTISDQNMHKKVMFFFLFCGMFYSFIAVILYFIEPLVLVKSIRLFEDFSLNLKIFTSAITKKGFIKRASLIANSNESALILNLYISIATGLLFTAKKRLTQLLLAILIAALVSLSLLTMSRGGEVGLIAMGIFIFGAIIRIRKYFVVLSILFLFVLISIYQLEFFVLNRILFSRDKPTRLATTVKSKEVQGVGIRLEFWKAGFKSMKKSPLSGAGVGVGSFKYYTLVNHAHNIYLSLIFDFGIAGVLFLFFIARFVLYEFSTVFKNQSSYFQIMSVAFLAGLVSIGVHGLVDFEYNTPFIWLYSGLAVSTINFAKQEIIQASC
ncbi:O-antigen ligase family protein [Desulfamplus magnetovallimortis]|uniref:O-antigen ligase family protein n=1 Tax=Desulfamplus magnetovallimortis TaxID=1246637 RepID=UPI0016493380|nr:O-antigen ligase family protein [Desulfamplus magnetovallimortis]